MESLPGKSYVALVAGVALIVGAIQLVPQAAAEKSSAKRAIDTPDLNPPAVATDPSVKIDYPIVYVRLLRQQKPEVWAQAGVPLQMNPGADLMLLHPDGREEVLLGGQV